MASNCSTHPCSEASRRWKRDACFIFADGSDEVVARLSPTLSTLGTVVPVGGVGAGSAAKLVANFSLISVLAALGEAFALGRHVGLTDQALFDVLAASPRAGTRRQGCAADPRRSG
jgi:3-hydroxyisobutyrate dehydrogenase